MPTPTANTIAYIQRIANAVIQVSNTVQGQTPFASNNIFKKSKSQFRDQSKTFLFQDVAKDAKKLKMTPRTQEGRDWFRNKASEVRSIKPADLFRKRENWIPDMSTYLIGRMLFFEYSDPKTKADLPYYDAYPLIFPFWQDSKYFMGINLHYLHPYLRAKLMDALYTIVNNDRFDDRTKLKLTYGTLKGTASMRYYKPCVKKYLKNRVKSVFLYITPREWDYVMMLPLQRFKKQSSAQVWQDSERIINR